MKNKEDEFVNKENVEEKEDEKENNEYEAEPEAAFENDSKKSDEEEKDEEVEILKKDREKLAKELQEAKDKVLRISADTDNYRKRLAKESEDKVKYANQGLILELLNVVDHLEMALDHSAEDSNVEALRNGVELTLKQFKDVLKKYGVEEIKAKEGDTFDPNIHEAMMLDERHDLGNNCISTVMQKGYKLHNRVIRSSKVRVNKKEEKNNTQEENNE
ncbi:nucleotide exchange factor GrpE [Flexistipes sp.]|uniref:nucleotide exchange factor GrpE n=1 Tax=Flexistipes sp. TaxID=3088135 RepID=UPI002E1C3250|nr:nucleotide exchange factor GrpE [Flexistipes sp.]